MGTRESRIGEAPVSRRQREAVVSARAKRGADSKMGAEAVALRELTGKARKALPSSTFVFPGQRKYPIQDLSHARNALARSSGKPEEGAVKAAVYKRYPQLKNSGKS